MKFDYEWIAKKEGYCIMKGTLLMEVDKCLEVEEGWTSGSTKITVNNGSSTILINHLIMPSI